MSGRAVVLAAASVVVAVGGVLWWLLQGQEVMTPVIAPSVPGATPLVPEVEMARVDVTPAPCEPETAAEVVEPSPAVAPLPPYDLEVDNLICGDITKSIAEQIVVIAKDQWRLVGRGVEPGDVTGAILRYVLAVLPELVELVADGRILVEVRPWPAELAADQRSGMGGSFNIDDQVLHFGWRLPDCYVGLEMTRRSGHPELLDQVVEAAKASMGK